MMMVMKSKKLQQTTMLVAKTVLYLGLVGYAVADSLNCKATTKTMFQCPNCGGINVTDCLHDCPGYLFQASQDGTHFCFDRTLFLPYNDTPYDYNNYYTYEWQNAIGAIVWFITAGLAISSGIGGGAIFLPMGILLLRFSPNSASGLSQASIVGAAIGGVVINVTFIHMNSKIRNEPAYSDSTKLGKQEPLRPLAEKVFLDSERDTTLYTRPLIPYDWLLFFSPMEMSGATAGLLVQLMFPDWLYLACAVVVLIFTAWKTWGKYVDTRNAEAAAKKKEAALVLQEQEDAAAIWADEDVAINDKVDEETPMNENTSTTSSSSLGETRQVDHNENMEKMAASDASDVDTTKVSDEDVFDTIDTNDKVEGDVATTPVVENPEIVQLRKLYLEEDSKQYPWYRIIKLFVLWLVLLIITLLKGGKGFPSVLGITCHDALYGVLTALKFVWLFIFAGFQAYKLHVDQQKRIAVNYPFVEGDQIWNQRNLSHYVIFTFAAGFIGGFIGICGGNFFGPFLLWKNVQPRVAAATTATMIILTSSSVAIMFVTSGLVPWSYAVFYFCITCCGALFGKYKIDTYVRRSGRASLLVLILTGTVVFAVVGCFLILVTTLSANDWCLDGFNKFCSDTGNGDECPVDRFLEEIGTVPRMFST